MLFTIYQHFSFPDLWIIMRLVHWTKNRWKVLAMNCLCAVFLFVPKSGEELSSLLSFHLHPAQRVEKQYMVVHVQCLLSFPPTASFQNQSSWMVLHALFLLSSLLSLEVIHAAWIFCLVRGGTSNSTVNATNHTYKVPQGWDLCMWEKSTQHNHSIFSMASRIAVRMCREIL